MQSASHRQPLIRQAQAATAAARGRVEEARAGYLPQVTATGQYQRTTGNFAPRPGSGISINTPSPTFDTFSVYNFGVTATQLLYDFGQTNGRWSAAEASVDALRASEHTTESQIALNVRTAFFQARAQKLIVTVAEATLANQKKHHAQIQGFVQSGTQPEIALAQANTDVANARVALIGAMNNYEVSKAQLNQAMGVAGDTDYEVADESLGPIADEDAPVDVLVEKALAARPEMVSLRYTRDAQERTVRAIKGAYGPSIVAASTATESGIALDGLVPNWNIGLLATWPLFQGGLTRGQVREAEANLAGIDAQVDGLRLQVRLDIDQARLAIRAAKATILATQDADQNARDLLRLAEGRYTAGVGSVIELGDAQVAASNAAAQLVQAQFALSAARAQLLSALGRR